MSQFMLIEVCRNRCVGSVAELCIGGVPNMHIEGEVEMRRCAEVCRMNVHIEDEADLSRGRAPNVHVESEAELCRGSLLNMHI